MSHETFKLFCKACILNKCVLTERPCNQQNCPPFIKDEEQRKEMEMENE